VIVVGASAGGVGALVALVRQLSADLPAAVLIVLHVSPTGLSVLPDILSRSTTLHVAHAVDGEPIRAGRVYVAPPDHHVLVDDGAVLVTRGPRENGHRPAIDPLFRTAAASYGPRVIGIVLSGALDDGAAGLKTIRESGGIGLVQDPADAATPGMPMNAIRVADPEFVVPVAEMGSVLRRLIDDATPTTPNGSAAERGAVTSPPGSQAGPFGAPGEEVVGERVSEFTCPDCGGTLWERVDDELQQFRCRVGHSFSAESLYARQNDGLEGALWTAVRALEERAGLAARIAERLAASGHRRSAQAYHSESEETKSRAALVREAVVRLDVTGSPGIGLRDANAGTGPSPA